MKTIMRFVFTIPIKTHKKARRAAFERNISLSKYVLQALVFRLENEVEDFEDEEEEE